jgi:hypothetical protein
VVNDTVYAQRKAIFDVGGLRVCGTLIDKHSSAVARDNHIKCKIKAEAYSEL